MTPIRSLVGVFTPERVDCFVIDAVELLFSPRAGSFSRRGIKSVSPDKELLRTHRKAWKIGRPEGHDFFCATIPVGDFVCLQRLSDYNGGDRGKISCLVQANVIRRLRDRLIKTGKYTAKAKRPNEREDNFIDPTRLVGGVDLHAESFITFAEIVHDARAAYVENIAKLFHLHLSPEEVQVSIRQIELTWDAPCDIAKAAPTILWSGWRSAFRGPRRRIGFLSADGEKQPDVREDGASDTDAEAGTTVLRADGVNGSGCKLYVKASRLLRFEAELTAERIADLLGRKGLKPASADDLSGVRRMLEMLAVEPYRAMLAAQEGMAAPDALNLAALMRGFHESGSAKKIGDVVEALAAEAHFHNEGSRYEKELTRLAKRGWVKHLGRGEWAATPKIAATFALLAYRARLPDATHPDAYAAGRGTRKTPTIGRPTRGGRDA